MLCSLSEDAFGWMAVGKIVRNGLDRKRMEENASSSKRLLVHRQQGLFCCVRG